MSYEMICASVRGASHIRKNIPCEDFGLKYADERCRIFVLGDGHGDTNCPRSSLGSEYICRVAAECLKEFAADAESCNMSQELFYPRRAEEIVRQLIKSIIGKWAEKVREYQASHPLTDEEKAQLSAGYAREYSSGLHIEHIYGTTLIAGLMTEKYLLLLQQGDGRCVVFDKNGVPSQPVPWDEKCMANITTSVCDDDAANRCRYKVIDLSEEPVIACFLGSDGVEDSFSSFDMMDSFYREIIRRVCTDGGESTEKYLMGYLPEFSAKGSADDTTVCGIIDIDAASEKLNKLAADTEAVSAKAALKKANSRLPQMTDKLNYLSSKCEELNSKVAEAENEEKKTNNNPEIIRVANKHMYLGDSLDNAKKELDRLQREYSMVRAEQYRYSPLNAFQTTSAWASRGTYLIIKMNNKLREISNLESAMKLTADKLEALVGDISQKIYDLKEKRAAAEKEYKEYYKKYENVLIMKDTAEKRLEELGKLNENSEEK